MTRTLAFVAILALPTLCPAEEPATSIRVTPPVHVTGDRPDTSHAEPYLVAHPERAGHLVAGIIRLEDGPETLADGVSDAFFSVDGGSSWSRRELPACAGDPWLDFVAGDVVLFSCLSPGETDPLARRLAVQRSDDGGRTWLDATFVPVPGGYPVDRPVIVADRFSEEHAGTVYVAFGTSLDAPGHTRPVYGSAVARSEDGGRTFEPAVPILHDSLDQQPFDAAILSDGTLVVLFMDYAEPHRLLSHRRTWLTHTSDGGRTFSLPRLAWEQREREMPWSLAVDRATDRLYLAVDGTWSREGATPSQLAEATAPGVFVIASDHRGERWGAPVAVSSAGPQVNAELPTIAVAEDGTVGVLWVDARHDPEGLCHDLYFTASVNRGRSFLPEVRVTPDSSCPAASRHRGVARRWRFGGDYLGLSADADGRFHLLWSQVADGTYHAFAAVARVHTGRRRGIAASGLKPPPLETARSKLLTSRP